MSDYLDTIIATKRAEVAQLRRRPEGRPPGPDALRAAPTRGFARALWRAVGEGRAAIIAEIKKASPSKGLICPDFDPEGIARAYHAGGACCLSVLTDEKYFQGSPEALRRARASCPLPTLRKDFIIDPSQVCQARHMGADAILLIMRALSDAQAAELCALAAELGLDVLTESHDAAELERALRLPVTLIGVNNRDLRDFSVDIGRCQRLAATVAPDRLVVAESGVSSPAALRRLRGAGIHAFLIGEALMRAPDRAAALRSLLAAEGEG